MTGDSLDLLDRLNVVRMPGVRENSRKIQIFRIRKLPRNIDCLGSVRLDANAMRAAIDLDENVKLYPGSSCGLIE